MTGGDGGGGGGGRSVLRFAPLPSHPHLAPPPPISIIPGAASAVFGVLGMGGDPPIWGSHTSFPLPPEFPVPPITPSAATWSWGGKNTGTPPHAPHSPFPPIPVPGWGGCPKSRPPGGAAVFPPNLQIFLHFFAYFCIERRRAACRQRPLAAEPGKPGHTHRAGHAHAARPSPWLPLTSRGRDVTGPEHLFLARRPPPPRSKVSSCPRPVTCRPPSLFGPRRAPRQRCPPRGGPGSAPSPPTARARLGPRWGPPVPPQ